VRRNQVRGDVRGELQHDNGDGEALALDDGAPDDDQRHGNAEPEQRLSNRIASDRGQQRRRIGEMRRKTREDS